MTLTFLSLTLSASNPMALPSKSTQITIYLTSPTATNLIKASLVPWKF